MFYLPLRLPWSNKPSWIDETTLPLINGELDLKSYYFLLCCDKTHLAGQPRSFSRQYTSQCLDGAWPCTGRLVLRHYVRKRKTSRKSPGDPTSSKARNYSATAPIYYKPDIQNSIEAATDKSKPTKTQKPAQHGRRHPYLQARPRRTREESAIVIFYVCQFVRNVA